MTWRAWASGRCSREPWPITFRPASRGSSYDDRLEPEFEPRRRLQSRRAAADAILAALGVSAPPTIGLVLGSGLGPMADRLDDVVVIPYGQIPHFPEPTVAGHLGRLVVGGLGGTRVAAFQGRFHSYEGHDLDTVTFPIRVLQCLGVASVILTAATGGINTALEPGDVVCLSDHLNLIGANPLRGPNDDAAGRPVSRHDAGLFAPAPVDRARGSGADRPGDEGWGLRLPSRPEL